MAGLLPGGVLSEILNESGDRASPEELCAFAKSHNLKIISIEQLIKHRRTSEKLVSRAAQARLPSKYGDFTVVVYDVKYEDQQPLALVMGDPATGDAPLVRLHSSCFTGDLVESLRCDCGDQLHQALVNLCTNAWHSLDDQPGTITIRLSSCTLDHPAAAARDGRGADREIVDAVRHIATRVQAGQLTPDAIDETIARLGAL